MINDIKKLRNNMRILNHLDLIKIKEFNNSELKIGVIELHLTQKCDLKCFHCSYGKNQVFSGEKKQEEDFPFDNLKDILALKPKAIVLAGGGEPLLYNDNGKNIEDVIRFIKTKDLNCKIGLITNGIRPLDKKVCKMVEWVRISLDATNSLDFSIIKSGDFQKRINTIMTYIANGVEVLGIGILYSRFNFNKILSDLSKLYQLLKIKISDEKLKNINFQYRATCPIESCNCPSNNYSDKIMMTPNQQSWWKDVLLEVKKDFKQLEENDFKEFIGKNTNLEDIFNNNYNEELVFKRCYSTLVRWIISSNGDIYPCVMKITNNSKKIGNIIYDKKEDIVMNEKAYYNLSGGYCSGAKECCKINGKLNVIVEKNYNSKNKYNMENVFF